MLIYLANQKNRYKNVSLYKEDTSIFILTLLTAYKVYKFTIGGVQVVVNKKIYLGDFSCLDNGVDVSKEYEKIALSNFKAAKILEDSEFFNEAGYLYIQSLEKKVKSKLFEKVDVFNSNTADVIRLTSHSIDKTIEYLILIYAKNDNALKEQLERIFIQDIFKNFKFNRLNNALRYPQEFKKKNKYTMLKLDKKDCLIMRKIHDDLDKYLRELYRM